LRSQAIIFSLSCLIPALSLLCSRSCSQAATPFYEIWLELAAGDYFRTKLTELNHPLIKEVRSPGLMIGVDLKEKAGRFVQKLTDQGVLALLAGANVIRFLPPLVITNDEIDRVVTALKTVLDS